MEPDLDFDEAVAPADPAEKVRLTIDLTRGQRAQLASVASALGVSSSRLVRMVCRDAVKEFQATGAVGHAARVAYERGVAEERARWLAFVAQAQVPAPVTPVVAVSQPVAKPVSTATPDPVQPPVDAVAAWRAEAFANRRP